MQARARQVQIQIGTALQQFYMLPVPFREALSAMHIGNQFSYQAHSPVMHIRDLITGLPHPGGMHMKVDHPRLLHPFPYLRQNIAVIYSTQTALSTSTQSLALSFLATGLASHFRTPFRVEI